MIDFGQALYDVEIRGLFDVITHISKLNFKQNIKAVRRIYICFIREQIKYQPMYKAQLKNILVI